MEKPEKNRFRKLRIAGWLLLFYLILCQSCLTFRYTDKQTRRHFRERRVPYRDSILLFGAHRIHFIETGEKDKPTLYFIHGSPGSWNAFKDYLTDSLLLRKYRMVAFDRPGFGHSDYGHAENLDTQGARLSNAIAVLGNGKPCTLVGHSLGGPVILKIASLHPGKYRRLVILAGSVDPQAETPERWRPIVGSVPLRYFIPGAMRMSNDELWWLKDDLFRLQPHLPDITSEVLVIHGTEDRLVPYENTDFLHKALQHAKSLEIIPIPKADHFIPWTHFDLIRDRLLDSPLHQS